MNKSIKSLIALSLAMNLITLVPQKPALAASDNDTDSNECFQEDGVFGDILDVDNIRDIFLLLVMKMNLTGITLVKEKIKLQKVQRNPLAS